MNENYEKLKQQIKLNSSICGISSDEVSFAKSLVDNKCKDKSLFVCEGLWAADKLIEKNIKVTHFFFNADKLEDDKISEENLKKIEEHMQQISALAASCGLGRKDIVEMFGIISEEG